MNLTFKFFPFFLNLAALSGCSTYSETFDCPPGSGVGCKSLSAVNQLVDEGKLPLEAAPEEEPPKHPEETLNPEDINIWVAGYEDELGGFQPPFYVDVSLKKEDRETP